MNGNITKINQRYTEATAESATLQELVVNELKSKKHVATEGLLWLTRGLEFMCLALNANVNNKSEELATSFRNAYGTTLKPHHSFVVKPLFSAAMSACPARNDFYKKLGDDEAKVNELMQQYLAALDKIIGILKAFVNSKEAKW
ncbi:het-c2 protein [Diaporthe amygdali]|uniref:het-c2 protein n=1 Tax=Phomopsis amygdali TaxID=1214568 RepID=UPI0022FF12B2|nr:het-c2 protein [Diaporthe amygdali]KAJ0118580.1 het-c2 protein [Diaporthe amygdali]